MRPAVRGVPRRELVRGAIPTAPSASQILQLQGDSEFAEINDLRNWTETEQLSSDQRMQKSCIPESASAVQQDDVCSRFQARQEEPEAGNPELTVKKGVQVLQGWYMQIWPDWEKMQVRPPKKRIRFIRFGEGEKGCKKAQYQYFHPPLCSLTESGRGCKREKCKFFHRRSTGRNRRQQDTRNDVEESRRGKKEFVLVDA